MMLFLVYDATQFCNNSTQTDLPKILRFYFANSFDHFLLMAGIFTLKELINVMCEES